MRGDFLYGFGEGDYWVHFEVDHVGPFGDPLVDEGSVVRFHELVAAGEIFVDPAGDVEEAFGGHAALVAETAVDGGGVVVFEVFDDHVLGHGGLGFYDGPRGSEDLRSERKARRRSWI